LSTIIGRGAGVLPKGKIAVPVFGPVWEPTQKEYVELTEKWVNSVVKLYENQILTIDEVRSSFKGGKCSFRIELDDLDVTPNGDDDGDGV
jgi:hypothetical protein